MSNEITVSDADANAVYGLIAEFLAKGGRMDGHDDAQSEAFNESLGRFMSALLTADRIVFADPDSMEEQES